MKTRMTFRVAEDLARALRTLPNQTDFVESALRDALGRQCPVCEGKGRIRQTDVMLPNWREAKLPRLERSQAHQLKALVRLARELGVTHITVGQVEQGLHVSLLRQEVQVLEGVIVEQGNTQLAWH